jgi:hypothetical protein
MIFISQPTIAEMKAAKYMYKFVRVEKDGKIIYRFTSHMNQHCQLVEEGETPVSAGTFSVWADRVRMEETYSSTLRIGTLPEDEDYLAKVFELPVKGKWED